MANTTSRAQSAKSAAVANFLAGAKKNSNQQELVDVPSDVLDVIKKITVVRSAAARNQKPHLYLQIETTEGSLTGNLHYSLLGIAEPGDTISKRNLQWFPEPYKDPKGATHYTFCGILQ